MTKQINQMLNEMVEWASTHDNAEPNLRWISHRAKWWLCCGNWILSEHEDAVICVRDGYNKWIEEREQMTSERKII